MNMNLDTLLQSRPAPFTVRPYALADKPQVRSLYLSAYPSARRSDLVDLDAMLIGDHPGYVVFESSKGIIACGISSPEFQNKSVWLWAHAILPSEASDDLHSDLTNVLIGVLPEDEAPYCARVEGIKDRNDFFENLGFEMACPVMGNCSIDHEIQVFERDVSAADILSIRDKYQRQGISIPRHLFLHG